MKHEPCYSCNRLGTSREHVPPQSFFPKGHRTNLITVPSCDTHNSIKSDEDEYLRMIMSVAYEANDIARKQIFPKVKRAIHRKPKKSAIFRNLSPVKYNNVLTGSFEIKIERLLNVAAQIFRGIFYFNYQEQWLEEIRVFPPVSLKKGDDPEYNNLRQNMERAINHEFSQLAKLGENPEIFYYRFTELENNTRIFELTFYEGVKFIGIFGELPEDFAISF